MLFGDEDPHMGGEQGRDSFGENFTEGAVKMADTVSKKARALKDKAANFWASMGTE